MNRFRTPGRVARTARSIRACTAGAVVVSVVMALGFVTTASPAQASVLGTAWAWGANVYGELGHGTTSGSSTPVDVKNLATGVRTIAAGARHSLAIKCDGSVVAWGRNTSGELGNGTTSNSNVPVRVSGLGAGSGVVAIDGNAPEITASSPSGNGHSMALESNGAVLGWGNNFSGQVGNGTASSAFVLKPVPVVGLGKGSGVVAIAAGASFSLALKSNGTVLAWGNNTSRELGNGTTTDHPKPAPVNGLGAGSGVVAIAAGGAFSLALKSNGTVLAWGNNTSGELGNGSAPTDAKTPVQVTGLGSGSGVVAISAGSSFAVALKSDGSVVAWGNNASGQLGNGTAPTDHSTPVSVTGLGSGSGVVAITTGFSYALARTTSGSLYAWGRNASGQLGDGGTSDRDTPELLGGFTNAIAVSAGGAHTLAMHQASFATMVGVGDASIMEGDKGSRTVAFPVTLSQPAATTVSVTYKVGASGSGSGFAKPGSDFAGASGTVTFTPSGGVTPTLKTISVKVYGDTTTEPNEVFSVSLTSSCSCTIGRAVAQGTIINDDAHASATVGIGGGSVVEGNSGSGRRVALPVTLSKPVKKKVSVHYTVSGSTAAYCATSSGCPDADFGGATTGIVKFVPSRKTGLTKMVAKISIPVWADVVAEGDESFTVTLSGLTGLPSSQLIHPSADGTIVDDD